MTAPQTPPRTDRVPVVERAAAPRQHSMEDGYHVLSYLVAGLLFYGGLGWLGDRWLQTGFLLPIGLIVGTVLSIYMIYNRFGKVGE